jgi:outer membrane murein-binding lipoprotein Lpp
MKRGILLVGIVLLVAGLLSGCESPEQARQRQLLANSLRTVQADLNNISMLEQFPTNLDRIRSSVDRLTEDWTRSENLARTVPGTDVTKASTAHLELVQAVDGLSPEIDSHLAMLTIKPKLDAFKASVDELYNASGASQ